MKKLFTKVAIFVAALAFPFTLVSCDNEELMTILGQVLEQMLAGQGTKYNFTGTATNAFVLTSNDGGENYVYLDEKNINGTINNVKIPVTLGNNAASMEFPSVTVNGITFPATKVANLLAAADGDYINIGVGDNTTADGTLTTPAGGSYPIYNIYFEDVKFTTNQTTGVSTLTAGTIQLYYGTKETPLFVVNYSYNGTATAAAQ